MDLFSRLKTEKKNKIILNGNEPIQANIYLSQIYNARKKNNLNIQKIILDKKTEF